ncbi:MAG: hypothetical protein FD149_2795, partial [Rhodospirillaceae bacterium]
MGGPRRTVRVPGPLLLDLSFEEGTLTDGSNRGHMVVWQGPAAFAKNGRSGQTVVLDGRNHVLIRKGVPFSGLSQMTLSFAWRGEGKGGDAGLVWLEGSFGVMLKGCGLKVMLVTRNGKTHRIDAEYPSA